MTRALPMLLLLLAAAACPPAAATNKNNNYDCTLDSEPEDWQLFCADSGACEVTLPEGSFPPSAGRVTCVLAFDEDMNGPNGLFSSFKSLLSAKQTHNRNVCKEGSSKKKSGHKKCAKTRDQVRKTTVTLTDANRWWPLTLRFTPKLALPGESEIEAMKAQRNGELPSLFVACAQQAGKHGKNRCSEEPDVQVLEEVACLPGDAIVRRVDAASGEAEAVRLEELRIGDEVECVAPLGEGASLGSADPADWTDAATDWKPATCRVFYYLDASAKRSRFVTLHYARADGAPAAFRATREHLAFVAGSAQSAGSAPPRGSAKRMDAVAVGDLLAVRSDDANSFYTAPVTKITLEAGPGAYAPLLTKAGLLVADGAVVFPHAHVLRDVPVHPMTNLGEYYRHARIWTEFENIVASGCEGDACPCLDARRADGFCAKVGIRLRDLPEGVSTFTGRSLAVLRAAYAEGRTEFGYETVLRSAPLVHAYLFATTRLPVLRSLFRPVDGPTGDVTHRLTNYMMRAPAVAVA